MTIVIRAIDREGELSDVEWSPDQSLMEALRDSDLPVLASCGGTASCATCHVYVPPERLAELGEKSDDESELLLDNDYLDPERSRLSCQIEQKDDLAGMTVELAPEE
ncbi:2Fe-2S iron-sulfur cluster-binding protein [Glaciibacter sp. 2TAF33]|uniref:2Fe-2S iron-sulfur cluster-binding protein n=1 Tax=Glaciibacter sp. 2TAF33 TaxID=3233015 RepID=UPI003F8DEE0E